MHLQKISSWLYLTLTLLTSAVAIVNADEVDDLAAIGLENIEQYEAGSASRVKRSTSSCTLRNVAIRREWSSLSKTDRKAYTDAVLCLMSKPSKSDPVLVPGAKNRYDDFVATHINQTLSIHGTANFLSWHRYFTWHFEQALRKECGYKGYQPYWNWGGTAYDPVNSAMFDGSAYSMGGNGNFVPNRNGSLVGGGLIYIPPSNGGGCVTTGPFKNMKVNLGPVSPTLDGVVKAPGNGLGYNPRCLRRDISPDVARGSTKASDTLSLILQNRDIGSFQSRMQGDFAAGFLGVHSGGHFTIGGDPGGDLFASPGDPAFWLHHGMIDRVWWIWQALDLPSRIQTIAGTLTINNRPPSPNGTLNDVIDLGVIAPKPIQLKNLMSTMEGPFCYIYL